MMKRLLVFTLVAAMGVAWCRDGSADELREAYNEYKALNEAGKYHEALPFAKAALRLGVMQFGEDSKTTAVFLNNLGALYYALGDYAKAEPLYKRALAISEKALGPDHPSVATGINNLGNLYYALGDDAKAEPLLKRALAMLEKILGPDHPNTQTTSNSLASLLKRHRPRTQVDSTGRVKTMPISLN